MCDQMEDGAGSQVLHHDPHQPLSLQLVMPPPCRAPNPHCRQKPNPNGCHHAARRAAAAAAAAVSAAQRLSRSTGLLCGRLAACWSSWASRAEELRGHVLRRSLRRSLL